jgi:hypothetical protein
MVVVGGLVTGERLAPPTLHVTSAVGAAVVASGLLLIARTLPR